MNVNMVSWRSLLTSRRNKRNRIGEHNFNYIILIFKIFSSKYEKKFAFLHFGWLVHGSVFYSLCTFFVFVKLFLKKNKPNTTKIKINSCIISHQIKIYRIKNPTSPLLSISILSPEVTTVDSLASIIPNNFLCNLYMLMCS